MSRFEQNHIYSQCNENIDGALYFIHLSVIGRYCSLPLAVSFMNRFHTSTDFLWSICKHFSDFGADHPTKLENILKKNIIIRSSTSVFVFLRDSVFEFKTVHHLLVNEMQLFLNTFAYDKHPHSNSERIRKSQCQCL